MVDVTNLKCLFIFLFKSNIKITMFVFWQNVREDGEQQYTVMGLSVHPDYRRKGYAKEIIRQMENKCIEKGVDKLYILVDKNNVSAINHIS